MQHAHCAGATIMIEEETCFGEQGGATHPMAEEVDYVVMLAGMGSSAANDAGGIRARRRPGRPRSACRAVSALSTRIG